VEKKGKDLNKENFQKWTCDYCRYRDMCMQKDKESRVETGKVKHEVEMEMGC